MPATKALTETLARFEATGIPHRTLMRRLRLNRATLYSWRRGDRTPRPATLMMVASGLRDYAREIESLANEFDVLAGRSNGSTP